jgi:60 kDa SS-A/Ro ribonucleoprotein
MATKGYASIVKGLKSSTSTTGQRVPRKGHEQIMHKNEAGGFVYKVSDEELVLRILILGTNAPTYYSHEQKLTQDAITELQRIIREGNGNVIVSALKSVYEGGRAPKQGATLFVLALLTQSDVPDDVKSEAYKIVTELRTFSQLYELEANRKALGSGKKQFGRGMRKALARLVSGHDGKWLSYQGTKYNSRGTDGDKWSIKDIIRCGHVASKNLTTSGQIAVAYFVNGLADAEEKYTVACDTKVSDLASCTDVISYIRAVEAVKQESCTPDTAIQLIRDHKLPREVLNTKLLTHKSVWQALLYTTSVGTGGVVTRKVTMPITALIRNLGVMSQRGLFDDATVTDLVCAHVVNPYVLKNGRVHPVALLTAMLTYQQGRGVKGSLTWAVSQPIVRALEDGFYVAFGHIQGTGKRIYHAVDCSGSMMSGTCALPHITACQAVSTLMMEAVRRESRHHAEQARLWEESGRMGSKPKYVQDVVLFNTKSTRVVIPPDAKLSAVMKLVNENNCGGTDCAQPMISALATFKSSGGKAGLYDLFVVYTDNETWYGYKHPSEALDEYRMATGIDARMVVVATTPTSGTIGYGGYGGYGSHMSILDTTHPHGKSPLCLNIVGFDLNAPELIRNFACGSLTPETVPELDSELVSELASELVTADVAQAQAVDETGGFEILDVDDA